MKTVYNIALAAALLSSAYAGAQGCSQCRETVGQGPAATQQAYRRGIAVLMVAGAVVFAGGFAVIRRFR